MDKLSLESFKNDRNKIINKIDSIVEIKKDIGQNLRKSLLNMYDNVLENKLELANENQNDFKKILKENKDVSISNCFVECEGQCLGKYDPATPQYYICYYACLAGCGSA